MYIHALKDELVLHNCLVPHFFRQVYAVKEDIVLILLFLNFLYTWLPIQKIL